MSGAKRLNAGKRQLRFGLTFPGANEGLARVCEYGSQKYDLYNYAKGRELSQYVDCMMRHLEDWWNGEDLDKESGLPHTDHIFWNAAALAHFVRRPKMTTPDDRPHKVLADAEAKANLTAEHATVVAVGDRPTRSRRRRAVGRKRAKQGRSK